MLLEILHSSHFLFSILNQRNKDKNIENKLKKFRIYLILSWSRLFIQNWSVKKPYQGRGERTIYVFFDELLKKCCEQSDLGRHFIDKCLKKQWYNFNLLQHHRFPQTNEPNKKYSINYKRYVKLYINPGLVQFQYHLSIPIFDIYNKQTLTGYKVCIRNYYKFQKFHQKITNNNVNLYCYIKILKKYFLKYNI